MHIKHLFERPIGRWRAGKADWEEKDVVAFIRGRLGLDVDEHQKRLLREGGSRVPL